MAGHEHVDILRQCVFYPLAVKFVVQFILLAMQCRFRRSSKRGAVDRNLF